MKKWMKDSLGVFAAVKGKLEFRLSWRMLKWRSGGVEDWRSFSGGVKEWVSGEVVLFSEYR